jgi:hypothetical protein
MKQFIAFHNDKIGFSIYKWDGEKYYLNILDSNACFPLKDVEKYPHAFLFADTLEEIRKEIEKKLHSLKYGNGKEGECSCPVCGYKYNFDYYDTNDGYYTAAIMQDFTQKVKCICGTTFMAKIKVTVSFDTEILK